MKSQSGGNHAGNNTLAPRFTDWQPRLVQPSEIIDCTERQPYEMNQSEESFKSFQIQNQWKR